MVTREPIARSVKGAAPPAETLTELLRLRAAEQPDSVHLHLRQDNGQVETLTYAQLLSGSEAVAGGLRARGLAPADSVALMLPTGRDFFFGFLGVLLAGGIPVPIYPPLRADQIEEFAKRQTAILRNAEARALITFRRAERLARLLRPHIPTLATVTTADKLAAESRIAGADVNPSPDDVALIQYTSGSTGEPKGVVLTHHNLLANVRAIGQGVAVRPDDVVICWLPLFHDMGLIGCWLFSLTFGVPLVALSPLAFLRRPERWLWTFHAYRGTLSPAPNFAYELCLRKVKEEDIEGLNLSSWRVALNGAESVNPDTIARFERRFAPYGFRPETMMPVYGLAESTVALTFHELNRPPRIDAVERTAFQRERHAFPVEARQTAVFASGPPARGSDTESSAGEPVRFVSVGRPLPGHQVRIVDDAGRPLPERGEGSVEFRGPSTMQGYHRNPQATAAVRTADGWTRTGDLGYQAEGDLFLTGRTKDLIIKAGRNIYPQEVEAVAADAQGVRRGCVAAFSVPNSRTGSEGLVLVAETRETNPAVQRRIAAEVLRRVGSVVRVSLDDVRLVPPQTIPKTPSGKLRRSACRDLYLQNALANGRPPAWLQLARLAGTTAWASLRQNLARLRLRTGK